MYTEFHEPEIDIQTIKYLIWLALSKKNRIYNTSTKSRGIKRVQTVLTINNDM